MNIDFVYEDEKHLCQEDYEAVFRKIIETTLQTLQIDDDVELSCVIVDDEQIHQMNRDYRHIDRATDVISFALKEELESRGATVYMTRTDDQDMTRRNYNYSKQDDMYLRALKIDEYQPDLFLSIHLNSSNSSAWGSQVFYYKKSEDGKRLADSIHNQMKTLTGTRKNISSSSFYILRATQSLGVLIECGFLSNANERGQLKSRSYHKKLATVISDGIQDYFQALSAPL